MKIYHFLLLVFSATAAVQTDRVPDGGIQPQLALSPEGRLHVIYFKGDPMGGDIFYTWRGAGERQFCEPMRVNRSPGSAIAAGTMRGPQMAVGRNGRVHVAWMGGNGAKKVQVGGQPVTPMLYARLSENGAQFQTERNLITHAAHLDGGGSVAADNEGNVYVLWHGAPPEVEGEENRALYVAHSIDDGKTFAPERKAEVMRKGACACCGLKGLAEGSGNLQVLFRSAEEGVNRNQLWLKSTDHGVTFQILTEDPWRIATCPASSAQLIKAGGAVFGAWESGGGVVAGAYRDGEVQLQKPAGSVKRKFPQVAVNSDGDVLLTWVEGAGWGTPGTLRWQLFRHGKEPESGGGEQTRAWSFGACYAERDGGFVILY